MSASSDYLFRMEGGDWLYEYFCGIFVLCLTAHHFYSIPRWKHLWTSFRVIYMAPLFAGCSVHHPSPPVAGALPSATTTTTSGSAALPNHHHQTKKSPDDNDDTTNYPHVTVAICAYNEGAVVPRTIDKACQLDWPTAKLTIHIYDDSQDEHSIQLIEQSVRYWKQQQPDLDIARLTRPDRVGYKAGNLRYNFTRVKGEFVAYFDADHCADADFLRNVMPYFYDAAGQPRHKVALVQTPWAYHNTHQNILTECDAFALDMHHVCEQVGRSINYGVFGFNGTGGVWRRQAIADAGGFTWETVTEDILLSYKAYLKGYELLYVREFPQCLEVPADILAHIQQKHRWTKGFLQVFRIFRWTLLLSPKVPFLVTYEFFSHVLFAVQLALTAVTLILYPHLKIPSLFNSWQFKFHVAVSTAESLLTTAHAILSKVPAQNGHYRTIWQRIARLRFYVPFCSLKLGMTFFEIKAALEGVFSNDATFLTTPKQGAPTTAQRKWTDDGVAYGSLLVALHQLLFCFVLNDPFDYIESSLLRKYMCFQHLSFCLGLTAVSVSVLWAKYGAVAKERLSSLGLLLQGSSHHHTTSMADWDHHHHVGGLLSGLLLTTAVTATVLQL